MTQLTEQQRRVLVMLPETEYGAALFAWITQEIEALDKKEPTYKVCNDPISEDFRYQIGMKQAFKRILRKPQELKNEQISRHHKE